MLSNFLWSIFIVLLLSTSAPPETASIGYIRLKFLAAKVFSGLLYKVRTNCDTTKPYIINALVCSVCTESIAFGFYRTDLASSFGLYEKTQAILSHTCLALG